MLLAPLAAKMLISATKRQSLYFFPEKFENATEQDWIDDFLDPNRIERRENESLDYVIIYNLALKAEDNKWKESSLDKVKEYILRQI